MARKASLRAALARMFSQRNDRGNYHPAELPPALRG